MRDRRRAVASRLLQTPWEELHPTVKKLRKLFPCQLTFVAKNRGRVPLQLFSLIHLVCREWTADTQEIEGVMSLVKIAVGTSNRISQHLIDSRVGIIKHLGMGSRLTKHAKWSQIQELFRRDDLTSARIPRRRRRSYPATRATDLFYRRPDPLTPPALPRPPFSGTSGRLQKQIGPKAI